MTADLAAAVKAVVDRAPKLTNPQRAKLRAILLPALPTAAPTTTEHDDAPGTRKPGRRGRLAAAMRKGQTHATP
jgi:hypothetical protein